MPASLHLCISLHLLAYWGVLLLTQSVTDEQGPSRGQDIPLLTVRLSIPPFWDTMVSRVRRALKGSVNGGGISDSPFFFTDIFSLFPSLVCLQVGVSGGKHPVAAAIITAGRGRVYPMTRRCLGGEPFPFPGIVGF